jgi:DNA-binding transcriptional ArsR family regulator
VVAVAETSALRVLAHPLRLRMLSPLTGASTSAMELSRELSISHPLVSYRLRQLHAAGVIELAEARPRDGGWERRFSYRPDPAQRAAGPRPEQESEALLAEAVCVELRRRSGDAVPARRGWGSTRSCGSTPPTGRQPWMRYGPPA